eukprot:TRINITY_DN8135_c0_g1_i1.p1 TRINITY_DN8135_c0_g1~~TRINITY_DN8135_c0_g1_i1.p1  ORF type:complete len:590 (-),score=132.59 TRINITY_DN8135_c0_g1_i1:14-1783(-)
MAIQKKTIETLESDNLSLRESLKILEENSTYFQSQNQMNNTRISNNEKQLREKISELEERNFELQSQLSDFQKLQQQNRRTSVNLEEQSTQIELKMRSLSEMDRDIASRQREQRRNEMIFQSRLVELQQKEQDLMFREEQFQRTIQSFNIHIVRQQLDQERQFLQATAKELLEKQDNMRASLNDLADKEHYLLKLARDLRDRENAIKSKESQIDDVRNSSSRQRWKTTTPDKNRRGTMLLNRQAAYDPEVDAPIIARRENIAREILSTEKTYVKTLKLLKNVFMDPLNQLIVQKRPLISSEEIEGMFSNLDELLEVNLDFLRKLGQAMENWSCETELGGIFLELAQELDIYELFINNYDSAIELYNSLIKRKPFANWIEEQKRNNPEANIYLQFFMIQPIQRIPRYILLLQDLIKYTPDGYQDKIKLSDAAAILQTITNQLNESKRKAELNSRIKNIEESLIGYDPLIHGKLTKNRSLIKEGLMEITGSGKYFYFFLFDDLFIHTSQKKGGYKVIEILPLPSISHVFLNPNEDSDLQLVYNSEDSHESVELFLTIPAGDAEDWISKLKECINEQKKRNMKQKLANQYLN